MRKVADSGSSVAWHSQITLLLCILGARVRATKPEIQNDSVVQQILLQEPQSYEISHDAGDMFAAANAPFGLQWTKISPVLLPLTLLIERAFVSALNSKLEVLVARLQPTVGYGPNMASRHFRQSSPPLAALMCGRNGRPTCMMPGKAEQYTHTACSAEAVLTFFLVVRFVWQPSLIDCADHVG